MAIFGRKGKAVTADSPLDGPRENGHLLGVKWPQVTSSIDRALRIMAARRAAGVEAKELQVVLQVCPGGQGYPKWRKERDRVLRRTSSRYGAATWPERVPEGSIAVLLVPYAAGRVGPALAAAKVAAQPRFVTFKPRRSGEGDLAVAQTLADWLHDAADDVALVLAPPSLERFDGARLTGREPFDLDLEWPLPAPGEGSAAPG